MLMVLQTQACGGAVDDARGLGIALTSITARLWLFGRRFEVGRHGRIPDKIPLIVISS